MARTKATKSSVQLCQYANDWVTIKGKTDPFSVTSFEYTTEEKKAIERTDGMFNDYFEFFENEKGWWRARRRKQ